MRIEYIMVIKIPIKDKIIINRDDQEIRNILIELKLVGLKIVNIEPKLPWTISLFKRVKIIPQINPIIKSEYFCIHISPFLISQYHKFYIFTIKYMIK